MNNTNINIAIVIPAHNEALTISKCLASVQSAIEQLPSTITATVLVVLDSCSDDTLALVKRAGVDYLCCDYQCVGQVRDFGIRYALTSGATWIACTDADSLVTADWLTQQIAHIKAQPTALISGGELVDDWSH